MEVKFQVAANRDLRVQVAYFSEFSLTTAERFIPAVYATAKRIPTLPLAGSPCDEWHPDLAGVRRLTVKGFRQYLLFYETHRGRIEILRVLHGARDLVSLLVDAEH